MKLSINLLSHAGDLNQERNQKTEPETCWGKKKKKNGGDEEYPEMGSEKGGERARRQRGTRGLLHPGAGVVLTASGTTDPRPLIKSIVEIHMETEAQAIIRMETRRTSHPKLVLEDCSNNHGSLRISMLRK